MSIKRILVGTMCGRLALSARESYDMVATVLARPENAGMIANDHLAGSITSKLCKEGGTFIDVGSHIGSVIDHVTHDCPKSKVISFEAIPEKVEHLRRKFPHVECHGCALGDSEGEVSFFVNLEKSGFSSLGKPAQAGKSNLAEIKVPLKTLDSLVQGDHVEVIKIDVEGAELGVLIGGEKLIERSRPVIMFESGPQQDDGLGYTKEAMWKWFSDRNYAVLVPNRVAHNDPGLTQEGFIESHLYPRRTTNYFAVPKERRDEVRDQVRRILGLN
ncbi:FkbM family methyltransferase [Paludisphaera mucosa]|uniref:FkbM family methyltransferase n=1 Tax=Paludisphaera mucosa TaxID=3030827 RepID=A0ABT6FDT7_9BACT|nr:FkbM family methyltransferase [Paludisphaera mucosa]MDG3005733.1 FkbM family methyltransferase [Paludisphaera mucosa]